MKKNEFFVVLIGVGSRRESPCVKMLSLRDNTERTSTVTKLKPSCVRDPFSCKCSSHKQYRQYCQSKAKEKLRVQHSFCIVD